MNVGLIDVDGHNFPNLALMRISAWHKARGDNVEWWMGDLFHYDVVYKSKVFSDAYSKDTPDPLNCDKVIKGGTGYNIFLRGGWKFLSQAIMTIFRQKSRACSLITLYINSSSSLSA